MMRMALGFRTPWPEPIGEPPPPVIRVVQNWYVEFSGHETGSKA